MFNLAVLSIQQAFNEARYGKRDFTKEGRINELLTSGIDLIISGLESISCEYMDKHNKMNPFYLESKISIIKRGIEDLEKLTEELKNGQRRK